MSQERILDVTFIICLLDILLTCNTGYYKRGIICKDRGSIWRKYSSEEKHLNICSLTPILIYNLLYNYFPEYGSSYQFVLLALLLRWKGITRITNRISQKYILYPNIRNGLSLLSLFLKILLIAHACACIWIFTARMSEYTYENSWIRTKQLINQPW